MIGHTRIHSWSDPQGFMNPGKVIIHEVKGYGMFKVFHFLGEGIIVNLVNRLMLIIMVRF